MSSRQSPATRDLSLHRPIRVKPNPPIATNDYRRLKLSIFNPEIVKQSLIVILGREASVKQITAAFSCRYRQVLTEKAVFLGNFLPIPANYIPPHLRGGPQAEGYIFQHLFKPAALGLGGQCSSSATWPLKIRALQINYSPKIFDE